MTFHKPSDKNNQEHEKYSLLKMGGKIVKLGEKISIAHPKIHTINFTVF